MHFLKNLFSLLVPDARLIRTQQSRINDLEEKLASTRAMLLEVQIRAETDYLTGLSNAYSARERFVGEISAVLRSKKTTVSVVGAFIDLDGFGPVNKTYGQKKGDAILRGFAVKLIKAFRPQDIVFRRGGDEFCVFLVDTHIHAGVERIRKLMELVNTDHEFVELGITASIGVASAFVDPAPSKLRDVLLATYELLLDKADQAMRIAKARGKNRCVSNEDLITT